MDFIKSAQTVFDFTDFAKHFFILFSLGPIGISNPSNSSKTILLTSTMNRLIIGGLHISFETKELSS